MKNTTRYKILFGDKTTPKYIFSFDFKLWGWL